MDLHFRVGILLSSIPGLPSESIEFQCKNHFIQRWHFEVNNSTFHVLKHDKVSPIVELPSVWKVR